MDFLPWNRGSNSKAKKHRATKQDRRRKQSIPDIKIWDWEQIKKLERETDDGRIRRREKKRKRLTTRTPRRYRRCRPCGGRCPRRRPAWVWTDCRTRRSTSVPAGAAPSALHRSPHRSPPPQLPPPSLFDPPPPRLSSTKGADPPIGERKRTRRS